MGPKLSRRLRTSFPFIHLPSHHLFVDGPLWLRFHDTRLLKALLRKRQITPGFLAADPGEILTGLSLHSYLSLKSN